MSSKDYTLLLRASSRQFLKLSQGDGTLTFLAVRASICSEKIYIYNLRVASGARLKLGRCGYGPQVTSLTPLLNVRLNVSLTNKMLSLINVKS